jgi:hypothetical protein
MEWSIDAYGEGQAWSIDVDGGCAIDVGSFALSLLQDRYLARVDTYDVSPEGVVSVSVALPNDPWDRRIALHWALVDRNEVMMEQVRQHCERSSEMLGRNRDVLDSWRAALQRGGQSSALPRPCVDS